MSYQLVLMSTNAPDIECPLDARSFDAAYQKAKRMWEALPHTADSPWQAIRIEQTLPVVHVMFTIDYTTHEM